MASGQAATGIAAALYRPTVKPPPVVHLEALVPAHADEMFDVLVDPAIYEFVEDDTPGSLEALRRRYAALALRRSPDGTQLWLNWVVRGASGRLLGYVQATVTAPGTAWVAYAFASRHWGQGVAQQAVRQMIRLLVNEHRVTRLLAAVDQRNARSLRLLERLGFSALPLEQQLLLGISPGHVLLARVIGPEPL